MTSKIETLEMVDIDLCQRFYSLDLTRLRVEGEIPK
jgi:hypothetical protein